MNLHWMIKKLILVLSFGLAFFGVRGQPTTVEEYRQQQEQYKKNLLMKQLDSGIYLMEEQQYLLADEKFRYVLQHIKSVPSDLTFYFGKNSYFLALHKQSVDWLNKYLQLKGTNGQFSEEAASLLRKAEAALLTQKIKEAQSSEEVLSRNYDIDCGPTGKVYCPVCKGAHVIIKKGSFGNEYKTCPYCNEHGILTCEEYNLLIRGELKPKF
jgi:hypothetical protein